jgi:hypothetical protein
VPEHPDDFDVALRTWSAQEEIVREAYAIAAILDLDPALAEEVSTACRGGNATHRSGCCPALRGGQRRARRGAVDSPTGREGCARLAHPSREGSDAPSRLLSSF